MNWSKLKTERMYFLLLCYNLLLIFSSATALHSPPRKDNLTNEIRVLFYHNPPEAISDCGHRFPNFKPTMKCRFPGHSVEILQLVTRHIGLQIVPVIHHTNLLGRYKDGLPNGLLALLANGTVDTICKLFARNDLNRQIFDFSRSLFWVRSNIAVRRHSLSRHNEDLWNLFYPYTASTWTAIGTMLLVQLLIFAVITNLLESRIMRRPTTFGSVQILWRMFRVQLQQPDGVTFNSMSGRFSSLVFGLLQCMLILSLYQSWIVTSLVGKASDLPFQNLKELIPLIHSGRYKFASPATNNWFFDLVGKSGDPLLVELKAALRKNPVELYENETHIMELVQRGTHVAMVQDNSPLKWLAVPFCEVVFISGGMPEKGVHFMFTKGFPFIGPLNEAIVRESVFMQRKHWKYSYLEDKRRNRLCSEHENQRKQFRPLGLVPFLGLCVVLLVGFLLGSMVFIAELAVFYFKGRRNKKMAQTKTTKLTLFGQEHQNLADALRTDVVRVRAKCD